MKETTSPIDGEALLTLVDGNEEVRDEIIDLFLDQYPDYMENIRGAIREEDAEALERAAQTLKGSVGNIQAASAHKTAHRLEEMGIAGDFSDASAVLNTLEKEMEQLKEALIALKQRT